VSAQSLAGPRGETEDGPRVGDRAQSLFFLFFSFSGFLFFLIFSSLNLNFKYDSKFCTQVKGRI
jgi:hypothetical protein